MSAYESAPHSHSTDSSDEEIDGGSLENEEISSSVLIGLNQEIEAKSKGFEKKILALEKRNRKLKREVKDVKRSYLKLYNENAELKSRNKSLLFQLERKNKNIENMTERNNKKFNEIINNLLNNNLCDYQELILQSQQLENDINFHKEKIFEKDQQLIEYEQRIFELQKNNIKLEQYKNDVKFKNTVIKELSDKIEILEKQLRGCVKNRGKNEGKGIDYSQNTGVVNCSKCSGFNDDLINNGNNVCFIVDRSNNKTERKNTCSKDKYLTSSSFDKHVKIDKIHNQNLFLSSLPPTKKSKTNSKIYDEINTFIISKIKEAQNFLSDFTYSNYKQIPHSEKNTRFSLENDFKLFSEEERKEAKISGKLLEIIDENFAVFLRNVKKIRAGDFDKINELIKENKIIREIASGSKDGFEGVRDIVEEKLSEIEELNIKITKILNKVQILQKTNENLKAKIAESSKELSVFYEKFINKISKFYIKNSEVSQKFGCQNINLPSYNIMNPPEKIYADVICTVLILTEYINYILVSDGKSSKLYKKNVSDSFGGGDDGNDDNDVGDDSEVYNDNKIENDEDFEGGKEGENCGGCNTTEGEINIKYNKRINTTPNIVSNTNNGKDMYFRQFTLINENNNSIVRKNNELTINSGLNPSVTNDAITRNSNLSVINPNNNQASTFNREIEISNLVNKYINKNEGIMNAQMTSEINVEDKEK